MKRSTKKMDADEAALRCGKFAISKEEIFKEIENSQDDRFKDLRSLCFGWVEQKIDDSKSREKKLMSMLPNGKIIFVDRSQNIDEIIPEDPYICLVYERAREAFAKILFPEYQPKIYIPPSRVPIMVYRDGNGNVVREPPIGNTYEERIISAIKQMELKGFDHVQVIYKKNSR